MECGDGGRVGYGGGVGYEVDRKIKTRLDGRSLNSSIKTGRDILHQARLGEHEKGV